MTFLENIFARLDKSAGARVIGEVRDGRILSTSGAELLGLVAQGRQFLVARRLKKGARCALYAPNSVRWVAMDLAMMAEGIIVVPLDARQVPHELAAVVGDSKPSLIFCSDAALGANIQMPAATAPPIVLFDSVFAGGGNHASAPPIRHADDDPVTLVYTSGTSGEPKGVLLTAGNFAFVLGATNARLDELMGARHGPDRVFQYAPFCFAAARVLLLTSLSRASVLTLSTDFTRLSDELKLAAPDYFVNVPMFLERVRRKIEESVRKRGGFAAAVFARAQRAYVEHRSSLCLWLARTAMFPAIRKNIGPNLKALICGSAPLSIETQLFFMMLGIPVLQVYGLTETTAICAMDVPGRVEPGRVGPAIPGVEMILSDNGEILVRGPNVFTGYWQRPAETAKALEGGWFHTGDQGEADARGNWRITGRLKNLIILNSGHNVAPEPLEDALAARLPEAQQVVLLGNQRSFLAALVAAPSANGLLDSRIQSTLEALNAGLPHYKQIRAFHVVPDAFSVENGLLTVNGKLKRDSIAARYAADIDQLYRRKPA